MTDKVFLDTNLLVYLFEGDPNSYKSSIVESLILLYKKQIILSSQVLNELFNVLTRKKLKSIEETTLCINHLIHTVIISPITSHTTIKAIDIHKNLSLSYWDSLIVASALESECSVLYTEDMQNNQIIENQLTIINPFISQNTLSN